MPKQKTSRDTKHLHPLLQAAWFYSKGMYLYKYPDDPEPRLSCTFRSDEDQKRMYDEGRSLVVAGKSMHNFGHGSEYRGGLGALAFDVYFNDDNETLIDKSDDTADWAMKYFERFAEIIKPLGIFWGGDWDNFVDGPHFQFDITIEQALKGDLPTTLNFGEVQSMDSYEDGFKQGYRFAITTLQNEII